MNISTEILEIVALNVPSAILNLKRHSLIHFTVTLTVYSISAAVFNLDDTLPLNLQVEVKNGVFQQTFEAPT